MSIIDWFGGAGLLEMFFTALIIFLLAISVLIMLIGVIIITVKLVDLISFVYLYLFHYEGEDE